VKGDRPELGVRKLDGEKSVDSMRILMVSDYFYPFLFGGGERRMYELAKRLARRHEVHIITRRLADSARYEQHEGIHIHRIFVPSRRITLESFINGLFFMLGVLFKSLRLGEFDVYSPQQFFPLPPTWVASKVRGRPTVATIHDVYASGWVQQYGFKGSLMALFENATLKLPYAKVVTVSNPSKEKLVASGISGERIEVIPNGVDIAAFDEIKAKKSGRSRIIYLGRLIEYKHVDDLFVAFSKLDLEAELYVVGEGPEKENLKELSRSLGIENRIFFAGFVDERRKIELLKSAQALVLPSTVEGFAIVLIEGMAAGTPVITADIPAVHVSVRDGETGLLFKPRDIKGLKTKLERLLRDKDLRSKLSQKGYELVKKEFIWDKIAEKVEVTLSLKHSKKDITI